jgi:hypothetical protein
MGIRLVLKELWMAMATPPYPSGRSVLKVLKSGNLKVREGSS